MLERAKELAKSLGKHGNDYVQIAKLNMDINTKLRQIDQLYGQLGKYICSKCPGGEKVYDEYTQLMCERVEQINREIANQRLKIQQIKSVYGARYCVGCGVSVQEDALYCLRCGQKLDNEALE